ncbi:hypothetical protein HK101_005933, partial [Irineochytrium annulatum]
MPAPSFGFILLGAFPLLLSLVHPAVLAARITNRVGHHRQQSSYNPQAPDIINWIAEQVWPDCAIDAFHATYPDAGKVCADMESARNGGGDLMGNWADSVIHYCEGDIDQFGEETQVFDDMWAACTSGTRPDLNSRQKQRPSTLKQLASSPTDPNCDPVGASANVTAAVSTWPTCASALFQQFFPTPANLCQELRNTGGQLANSIPFMGLAAEAFSTCSPSDFAILQNGEKDIVASLQSACATLLGDPACAIPGASTVSEGPRTTPAPPLPTVKIPSTSTNATPAGPTSTPASATPTAAGPIAPTSAVTTPSSTLQAASSSVDRAGGQTQDPTGDSTATASKETP